MKNLKRYTMIVGISLAAFSCQIRDVQHASDSSSELSSIIEQSRMQKVKSAIPKTRYSKLNDVLNSSDTYWYDHDSLPPAYQASVTETPPYGANSNDDWFPTIADSVRGTGRVFYDEQKKRFKFPFGTTAGTDDAKGFRVVNFISLPKKDGKTVPVMVNQGKHRFSDNSTFTSNAWSWRYPIGTMVGEFIFIETPNGKLLPSEIRTRVRFENEWAVNVFRPFPTAQSLANQIKKFRPDWSNSSDLSSMIEHLENPNNLSPLSKEAVGMPGVFKQNGHHDVLPDFNDDQLVEQLLTQTHFVSSYGLSWKKNQEQVAFAPSSKNGLSIVPNNYEGGLFEVNEQSCARCHSETARHLTTFKKEYSDIVLYGEMWGRDGIFSFHPFDDKQFSRFWLSGTRDNRQMHPKLETDGLISLFNQDRHSPENYPSQESGGWNKKLQNTPIQN